MPQPPDHRDSNIDLPASPFTIVCLDAANDRVRTYQGWMSTNEIAELFAHKVRSFDWSRFASQEPLGNEQAHAYDVMLDVVSLAAEIDLPRARALWQANAPAIAGVPRMLTLADESQELRYLRNLANQRDLNEDELASHILEEGPFMTGWAEERRQLVTP